MISSAKFLKSKELPGESCIPALPYPNLSNSCLQPPQVILFIGFLVGWDHGKSIGRAAGSLGSRFMELVSARGQGDGVLNANISKSKCTFLTSFFTQKGTLSIKFATLFSSFTLSGTLSRSGQSFLNIFLLLHRISLYGCLLPSTWKSSPYGF